MTQPQHLRRGSVLVGRIMVAAACLLVLVANGVVFQSAASQPHPLPELQLVAVASLAWIFTGAWCMCIRKVWARGLTLSILYAGSLASFLAGVIAGATNEGPLVGHLQPLAISTAIYLFLSLVLTHSRHVRRLTSRIWD